MSAPVKLTPLPVDTEISNEKAAMSTAAPVFCRKTSRVLPEVPALADTSWTETIMPARAEREVPSTSPTTATGRTLHHNRDASGLCIRRLLRNVECGKGRIRPPELPPRLEIVS